MITKLNQDIQRLGESKLSAMTESKDFRSGTRTLLWEKDKLAMEYQDLQMKWTEIQQTKLTKESRHALQAGEHINKPTLAQEYAILDKAATASETYLKDRLEHLDTLIEDIEKAAAQKDAENKMLQKEIEEIKTRIELEKDPNKDSVIFDLVDNQPQRMQKSGVGTVLFQKSKNKKKLCCGYKNSSKTTCTALSHHWVRVFFYLRPVCTRLNKFGQVWTSLNKKKLCF